VPAWELVALLKAASTRSGLATHKMKTARRGKIPAKITKRQPSSFLQSSAWRTAGVGDA
jgi:hypothetical protein